MNREQYYKRQQEIGDKIDSLTRSCIKETARGVVKENCKAQLEALWQEFHNNHAKLELLGINDPYIKNQYYLTVKIAVGEIAAALKSEQEESHMQDAGTSSNIKIQDNYRPERQDSQMKDRVEEEFQDFQSEKLAEKKKDRIRKLIYKVKSVMERLEAMDSKVVLGEAQKSLEGQMKELDELFWDLSFNHDGDCESISREIQAVEELYDVNKTDLLQKLDKLNEQRNPIKLAEIKIPDFYGKVEEWSSFHDLYKQLIHDNGSLSDVEKMFHLKADIKGEASKVIKHLTADGSNYKPAWEIIIQRYGNKRILFETTLDRLLDQPHVNSENTKQVKTLLNTTIECVQGLRARQCDVDDSDAIIARIIIRKLDKEGLLLYEQHTKKSKEIQELKDVLAFLEERWQILEAAGTRKYSSNQNQRQQQPMRSVALYTDKNTCLYCKRQGHPIVDCRSFLRLLTAERVAWAKSRKICCRCLGHNQSSRCEGSVKCGTCGFNHHTILHLNKTSTTCVANGTKSVLLATAQVQVKNVHGEVMTLKALVDQGSQ